MALDLEMFEYEDKSLPATLLYDETYGVVALRGTPVKRAHLAAPGLFLSVFASYDAADDDPLFTLSDADSAQIEWVNEETGEVLFHFPGAQITRRGAGMYFQTVAKLLNGRNMVPENGTGNIHIKDNKVGRK